MRENIMLCLIRGKVKHKIAICKTYSPDLMLLSP